VRLKIISYHNRRRIIRKHFHDLGWGAQTKASFDLRIAISTISRVLNGKYYSPNVLEKLRDWIDEQKTD